jgi:hypothetical protein
MPTSWPSVVVAPGDIITSTQLNLLPIRIASTTVGLGGAATIDFQNIPAIFSHLLLELYGRGDAAATTVNVLGRFNNDTAANYDHEWFQGSGSGGTVTTAENLAQSSIFLGSIPGATAPANVASGLRADLHGYAATTFQKSLLAQNGVKAGTTTGLLFNYLVSGYWRSTAAINRLTLLLSSGNFAQGSQAILYGL